MQSKAYAILWFWVILCIQCSKSKPLMAHLERPNEESTIQSTVPNGAPPTQSPFPKNEAPIQSPIPNSEPPNTPIAAPSISAQLNGQAYVVVLPNSSIPTLTWESTLATSCQILVNGIVYKTNLPASDQQEVTGLTNTSTSVVTFQIEVLCQGLGGESRVVLAVLMNPTVQMTFGVRDRPGTSVNVLKGSSFTIEWTTQYAALGCDLTDGVNSTNVAASGELLVTNIDISRVYTLGCRDSLGVRVESSLSINVKNPKVWIYANDQTDTYKPSVGSDVTISWRSKDVNSCAISPVQSVALSGSYVLASADAHTDRTYTITCQSEFGERTKSIVVLKSGRWYQANQKECIAFCTLQGLTNTPSISGFRCASGEQQPPHPSDRVNFGDFSYTYGTWPLTWASGSWTGTAVSVGTSCYPPGGKQDGDDTDRTVACFCS